MKTIVLVLLIGGLGIFAISALVKWRIAHEQRISAQRIQEINEETEALRAVLITQKARLIALRHGEAASALYLHCHASPPTTEAHQLECKQVEEQLARDDASDDAEKAKHPW